VAELGFVLVVATIVIGLAIAIARDAGECSSDRRLVGLAVAALLVGGAMMRFGGASSTDLRARGISAIAAFVFGLGNALASSAARQRVVGVGATSLRVAAASAIVPLALGGAGAAIVAAIATGSGAIPTMMFGWAVGSVIGSLLSGSTDSFPLVALVTAATTVTCANVASRNLTTLRDVGPRAPALIALAPLVTVLSCVAVLIGVLSVRAESDEAADAALLRGFAVASTIGTLSAIAASHWWARPAGRGAWLALSSIVASIGGTIVLLIGRYYDDPLHRAARAVARAQRGGPRTRMRTGLRFGAESAALVLSIAVVTALAARRLGSLIGLEDAGSIGISIAVLTSLSARGYLDAIATAAAAGEARTLAHDLYVVALVTILLLSAYASVALTAGLVALSLVAAAIVERVAAAHADEGELRRRAAVLPVIAGGVLAASALLEAVLGS
jgi:hypothetical protein